MTFKLGAQLDDIGDPNLPFKLYESYIKENRRHFPDSVLEIIAHPGWSGGSASRAPYYSGLVSVVLDNLGNPKAELKLTLLKEMYVEKSFHIEIIYKGLYALDIPSHKEFTEKPLIWRYEEFLKFNTNPSFGIEDKIFTHQIEWTDGSIWSVSARDIEVQWKIS
jgi:hypothetical protein